MAIDPQILNHTSNATATYSPGAGEATTISTISVHNTAGASIDANVYVDKGGAAATITERLASFAVPDDGTVLMTLGITVDENDTVTVTGSGNCNIHIFGIVES